MHPEPSSARSFPARLTSRRGAWIALALAVLVFVGLFGLFGRAEAPGGNDAAPASSESAQAQAVLDEFPGHDVQSLSVVAVRTDGGVLTAADKAAFADLAPIIDAQTGHEPGRVTVSDDGEAAVMQAPLTVSDDSGTNAERVDAVRDAIAGVDAAGLDVLVTGGPAFGADITNAFAGADITLLLVTIAIVALLLVITYRSPVLWLLPLTVIGIADQLAAKVTAALSTAWNLQFDTGVVSVLVFGAGTNYALLLISRYREELARHDDHRTALAVAWRKTVPAIVASNLTVVLALATLVFAVIPGTHGLGIAAAVGLLIAAACVLLVLPPVLAVCGRRVFWPFTPRPREHAAQGRVWGGIANRVVKRPTPALVGGLVVVGVMAAGLFGTTVGLTQVEKFRGGSESATGLTTVAAHFPAGEAQPMIIVADADHAQAVADAAQDVPGVTRAMTSHDTATVDGTPIAKIVVVGEPEPGSDASLDLVRDVRTAVHEVPGADALVGGAVATDVDARDGAWRDLLLIAPLVLAISLVVLVVLLRSLVAPILLLLVNLASAAAAIGAGAWLGRTLFGWQSLDLPVPLLAFIFLVALGIDYTIFLVHRAKTEADEHGTRRGMARAVASTGGVITSAGIVLAGVFAALGVLPLVTLGQLGLIVGLGVIVDTLVVRTIVVPALFALTGDRIWWPHRPAPRYRQDDALPDPELVGVSADD
ncbi:MMPL family transporter [Microbacterium horticulturae]|uniref:MMPL family transporter n=1 Tax=Microbacterium horticulturae TaxID=3028316 RepID=A0ABY8C010_9MICO|nr:MMPL family transporter [Microbacterium sp. KACC 23027]WEG09575.1 MMPL family transporter [Microbacterium sp. KACC 23027]